MTMEVGSHTILKKPESKRAPAPKRFDLDPKLFSAEQIHSVNQSIRTAQDFVQLLNDFNYGQLTNLQEALIEASLVYYRDTLEIPTNVKALRSQYENLLDYKERTGCSEPIEACLNDGCFQLRPDCAVRKIKEDISVLAKIFELRKHRSSIPHVAIELFFKKIIDNYNSIGLILSDKSGAPKVFTTDGSGISSIITEGTRRLTDAVAEQEFRFSKPLKPYLVYNQRFPLDEAVMRKLHVSERNPELTKYIKSITFSSVGFEIAHEKMILSVIYFGDNLLHQFLKKAMDGIARIKLETDPEARIRSEFGKQTG
jgi:hypothetical protein